jgi:hypothetical protein
VSVLTENELSPLTSRRCDILVEGKRNRDANFCTVMALALLADQSYDDAYAALQLLGRPHRRGAQMYQFWGALALFHYRGEKWFSRYGADKADCPRTILTAGRKLPKIGKFLIDSTSHVAAFIDGEIIDSPLHLRKRVIAVWEIVPTDLRSKNQ